MGCSILPDLEMLVSLSVPRARAKGPYEAAEMALLRDLGRHVEQALRISLRITNLEASEAALLSAMDTVAAGIYGLSGRGQLVLANRHGRERFDDCFATVDGRMAPRVAGERRRFQELVVTAGQADLARPPPRPCTVTGQDGRRVAAWALPVTASARWRLGSHDEVRILVLAVPVGRGGVVDPAVIRDLFGLTLGEARLASLIGSGVPMGNAADRLGVTGGTARVVLKQVFRKLGVNRQAELALQVANLAGFEVGKGAPA